MEKEKTLSIKEEEYFERVLPSDYYKTSVMNAICGEEIPFDVHPEDAKAIKVKVNNK